MNKYKAAMLAAVNWLRENPDKHIRGTFAKNEKGGYVDPNHPEAVCFCAYGRFLKELDLDDRTETTDRVLSFSEVWTRNDGYPQDVGADCPVDQQRKEAQLGQICALDYLEEVANKLED